MTADESVKLFGLTPSDEDLSAIRDLLTKEAEAERLGSEREEDLALLCCVQLFSRGLPEDSLRIWDAKTAGFDLGCYLDVQLLCGAGIEETKTYLAAQPGEIASSALERIREGEEAGEFDAFSPEAYLEYYRGYFGA